jgi:PPOX class probable F420-dependent enzyme
MPKLSTQEMLDFLAERGHLARIATIMPTGAPSVVPVWFIYENGNVMITPRKHSAFLANLRHDPRVAITIDEEAGSYRKVLFEGNAEILFEVGRDREWDDIYRRIACRYIDEASADYYLAETKDQPRALIGIDCVKARITTWRMPTGDEPYSGIWARRYYEPVSKMAASAGRRSPATGEHLKIR